MSKRYLAGWLVVLAGLGGNQSDTEPPVTEATAEVPSELVQEPVMERVKAEVGVGQSGRSLDNETGVARMISEPARAYFSVAERTVFDIQIPQAMQLFKAMEGRSPNSHDEFMTKIVRANSIQLPKLAEGQKYIFEPSTSELMVEQPASP